MIALEDQGWFCHVKLRQKSAILIIPAAHAQLATHAGARGAVIYTHAVLQMSDVPVNVHGGCHTVLGDILIVGRTQLTVHSIDTGNGNALIPSSDIPAQKREMLLVLL